jgi:hypothetical protein
MGLLTKEYGYEPKGTPYASVTELFAGLDKWSCDCRMYSELILLYAWHESLRPEQFDKKFASLSLSPDSTTGMDRQEAERGPPDNTGSVTDDAWNKAPVGTKVDWCTNSSARAEPWECEHAIKTVKGATPDQDRYGAQDANEKKGEYELSEYQIKRAIALHTSDSPFSYKITGDVIAKLRADANASQDPQESEGQRKKRASDMDNALRDLESIKGKEFKTSGLFRKQPPIARLERDTQRLVEDAARIEPNKAELDSYIQKNIYRSRAWTPK